MKIGIDARSLAGNRRGVGQYLFEILKNLSLIDRENEYFLYSHKPIDFEPNNARWHKRIGSGLLSRVGTFWLQTKGCSLAKADDIDVFWGPSHILPLRLPSKIKKLLTIHDLVWIFYPETMNRFNYFIHRLLANLSLCQADKIICVSNSTASDLIAHCQVDQTIVEVIYEGVDLKKYKPLIHEDRSVARINNNIKPDGEFLLFLGSIEPRKNLQRVLEAFKKVKQQNKSELKLVIVGALGWKTEGFLKTLANLDIENNIVLTGYLTEEEKVSLLQGAKMLVFPSLYEGFGLPLLEAMACGIPVITSKLSSLPEISQGAAILVDPLSVEQIADAIIELISNETLRQDLIEKGLIRVKQYSWADSAKRLLFSFNKLGDQS